MKLKIDAQRLRQACAAALSERSGQLEVLKHVLIETGADDQIRMVSTDSLKMREEVLAAEILENGSATFEPGKMVALLTGIQGQVTLTLKDGRVVATLPGRRSYRLETLDPATFWVWPKDKAEELTALTPDMLRAAFDHVAQSVAIHDPSRPFLNGLGFGPGMIAGATGFASSRMDGPEDMPNIVIPRDAIPALAALVKSERMVQLYLLRNDSGQPNGFRVVVGVVSITTKLLDAQYPCHSITTLYNQVRKNPRVLKFKADDLLGALTRLKPFTEILGGKAAKVIFKVTDGALALFGNGAEDEVVLVGQEGFGKDATSEGGIDPELLRRVAEQAKGGELHWHIDSMDSNYLFTIPGRGDEHVIAPMRI